jgi:hypothetical protein
MLYNTKKFTKPITDLNSHVNKKLTHGHVEHHGYIWLGPGELYAEPPVLPRHAVLQRPLVEEVGGELAQLGMHPVQMEFLDISLTKDSIHKCMPRKQGIGSGSGLDPD